MDAEEALQKLIKGNRRFVADRRKNPRADVQWRDRLVAGQNPYAVIFGCSDSRVPPTLLFDQGTGDLFVVRVAGHAIDHGVVGSIGYAVRRLGTRLVVVLGHGDCGAVKAALATRDDRNREPASIRTLLERLDPAIQDVPSGLTDDERVTKAIEANVRWTVEALQKRPGYGDALAEATVVGALYDLESGRVEFL